MKNLILLIALFTITTNANSGIKLLDDYSFEQIINIYNVAAKEKVAGLQIDTCETIDDKQHKDHKIHACFTGFSNALLTIDTIKNNTSSIWLMLDVTQLNHPSDITRVAGLLIRTVRGGAAFGNYLEVGKDILFGLHNSTSNNFCLSDIESKTKICVDKEKENEAIYNFIIETSK